MNSVERPPTWREAQVIATGDSKVSSAVAVACLSGGVPTRGGRGSVTKPRHAATPDRIMLVTPMASRTRR